MVLDEYRQDADAVLEPVAKAMGDTHPDTLTWTALFCAVLAGAFFALSRYGAWLMALGAFFVFMNGVLDALDGKIAKMSGKASRKGDLLDHVVDRYADFFMIGGIMLSPYCRHAIIGLAALLGVFMTSYMGTQAQAVGAKRDYSGILGRADRLALLITMPLLQYMLIINLAPTEIPLPWAFSINLIEIMLIWFAIAGNATAIQRGMKAWRHLSDEK